MSDFLKMLEINLAPDKPLPFSKWMEENLVLPTIGNKRPGPFTCDDWQIEPYDALSDPNSRVVVYMWCAQSGKSTAPSALIMKNMLETTDITLLAAPTMPVINRFVDFKLTPLYRTVPRFADAVKLNQNGRLAHDEGIRSKIRGEIVKFGTAGAGSTLQSIPARYVVVDEYDGFSEHKASTAGDPLSLLLARGRAQNSPLLFLNSTPTQKGDSLIEEAYNMTNMCKRFVMCIFCGHEHTFEFENVHRQHDTGTWHLVCPECEQVYSEEDRLQMTSNKWSWWEATNEHGKEGYIGYHISALYLQDISVHKLMSEYYNPTDLNGFFTQQLARTYVPEGIKSVDEDSLSELFGPSPDGRLLCRVAGIDTQTKEGRERYEMSIVDFYGSYDQPIPYVRTHFTIPVEKKNGKLDWITATKTVSSEIRRHRVDMGFIDIGVDARSKVDVKQLLRLGASFDYKSGRIRPIKGIGIPYNKWAVTDMLRDKRLEQGIKYSTTISLYSAITKLWIFADFVEQNIVLSTRKGALPDNYIKQLCSESLVQETSARGKVDRHWKKRASIPNEALDCLVYSYCAFRFLGPDFRTRVGYKLDQSKLDALLG